MAVVAVTPILFGKEDGTVVRIEANENVTGLKDSEVIDLLVSGSAVEIGSDRKYTAAPTIGPQDEATLKRDALLARAATGTDALYPAVAYGVDQRAIPTDLADIESRHAEAAAYNASVSSSTFVRVPADQQARHLTQENADALNAQAEQAQAEGEKARKAAQGDDEPKPQTKAQSKSS